MIMKKLFIFLTSWRFVWHWLYYKAAKNHDVMDADVIRNLNQFVRRIPLDTQKQPTFFEFCYLMTFYVMFRNIFYARVAYHHKMMAKFMSVFAQPLPLLDISSTADIGGGLIVQHGYATIIAPRKIGKNCWVNQGVTIGYTNDDDCPTLGDNVTVYCGAKVLGNVTIGDNVSVAANACVVKDVEPNIVVGGVPARMIKTKMS